MLNFAQPIWLTAGLLSCLGALLFLYRMERRRQARLARFAGAPLVGRLTDNLSTRRRRLKKGLWLAALFSCFVALARPQVGFETVAVKRRGIDLLFALDTSKSMLSEDVRPNRLERAKLAIMDFVHRLEGDRVGLIPFAGTAFLVCPLTIDYSAFESTLGAVDTAIIPRGGTNLAAAIDLAGSALTGDNHHKILILLTDGENLEGDALAAAAKAGENGMTIFTVGVGTPEGELIPQPEKGGGQFLKDEMGRFVTSRLDEPALAAIAAAAGGQFVALGKNGEGLEQIYQQKLRLIPKQELLEKERRQPLERFSWPLAAAILLLAVEFMISGRKSAQPLHNALIKTVGRRIRPGSGGKILLLCLSIFLAGCGVAPASQGERAYEAGDYLRAGQWYEQALKKNPDDPRLHYNAGTAAYRNNLFDQAIASFERALQGDDLSLREKSYYNLGNALYQKGEELARSDPGQAQRLWQRAMDAYAGSLDLNPEAQDSRDNRELVAKRLEELKKQWERQGGEDDRPNREQERNQDQGQDGSQGEQPGDPEARDQLEKRRNADGGQDEDAASSQPDRVSGSERQSDDLAEDSTEPGGDIATGEQGPGRQSQSGNQSAARPNQAGKMSEEEARQLLNQLREEEGRLNVVPRQSGSGQTGQEGAWRDW